MNERYIRRHAPGGAAEYQPAASWPRPVIVIGWMIFTLAVALLILLFASAARQSGRPVDGSTWVTPTTYGPPCHEDQPCGVHR